VALGPYPSALTVSPTGPEAGDIYVADSGNGIGDSTVSVIDPATNTVVHTIDVGTYSSGLAVSPTGPEAGDVYVINNNFDGLVRVIDPSTNTVVHTIDAPLIPHDVAVSPTGSTAGDIYVTGGDTAECEAICLAVIDPSDNTVVDTYTIDSQVGGPSAVTISPTGPEAGDIYATDESNLLVIEP
jgi:YVTN family beta-propeller protein